MFNIILASIILVVLTYVFLNAFLYAFKTLLGASLVISGATLANHYGGQTAVLVFLVLAPFVYVIAIDLFGTVRRLQLKLAGLKLAKNISGNSIDPTSGSQLAETPPLVGEWISGKTPSPDGDDFKPMIGDMKSLPGSLSYLGDLSEGTPF